MWKDDDFPAMYFGKQKHMIQIASSSIKTQKILKSINKTRII